ncbi:hypothetical protein [Streptomyces sp. NPDC001194]|uniref:hypothetical protein n=1 Tax=Streptomyces sp. NPDC001194 TaxID=3364547 RepID=UPI00369586AB
MNAVTVIPLGDNRATTFTVQTLPVTTGSCADGHGSCGKPGVVAIRNTLSQEEPAETSTHRVTFCAEHQDAAPRMHAVWVDSARELQDPVKNAAFLASAGITD